MRTRKCNKALVPYSDHTIANNVSFFRRSAMPPMPLPLYHIGPYHTDLGTVIDLVASLKLCSDVFWERSGHILCQLYLTTFLKTMKTLQHALDYGTRFTHFMTKYASLCSTLCQHCRSLVSHSSSYLANYLFTRAYFLQYRILIIHCEHLL